MCRDGAVRTAGYLRIFDHFSSGRIENITHDNGSSWEYGISEFINGVWEQSLSGSETVVIGVGEATNKIIGSLWDYAGTQIFNWEKNNSNSQDNDI